MRHSYRNIYLNGGKTNNLSIFNNSQLNIGCAISFRCFSSSFFAFLRNYSHSGFYAWRIFVAIEFYANQSTSQRRQTIRKCVKMIFMWCTLKQFSFRFTAHMFIQNRFTAPATTGANEKDLKRISASNWIDIITRKYEKKIWTTGKNNNNNHTFLCANIYKH